MAQRTDIAVVLVDTTVWVDFFNDKDTAQVRLLERYLLEGVDICTCGVIFTEVLQGIRKDSDYMKTRARFDAFLFLPMERQTFVTAADMYRKLRKRGITIRKTVDCIIAAVAIEHDIPLLHNDRDFNPIEKVIGLKVVKTG